MPKHLLKELSKCKHPESRKTLALARKIKKINNREKKKVGHAVKANIVGKKLGWFATQLEERTTPLLPKEFEQHIESYLQRFDEELEQIKIAQSIGKQRVNQHASRESAIKITLEKDTQDFNGGGIELPDLCDPIEFKKFQNWDGNSRNIQHLKLRFISRKYLSTLADAIGEQSMQE